MSENEFAKLLNDVSDIKKRLAILEHRLRTIEIALEHSHTSYKRPQVPTTKPLKMDKKTREQMARI